MNGAATPLGYRLTVSGIAVLTAVSPYIADFNETHIYNPRWTPHAKFHAAQTMLLGTALGGLTLALAWGKSGEARNRVDMSAVAAASFWLTQAGSLLFPGTAVVDPEFGERLPKIGGMTVTQAHADVLLLGVLAMAWWRGRRSSKRTNQSDPSVRH
ncbi:MULTISPECIES: DUF6640 family protein [unclassified Sphingomonas]|uniref:DUF6640 family protein n=1 Tax=unclassified Sphingomonas TaxID=196159 RepID=UPI00226AD3FE|nr:MULTISPECIES: DUF6640 family protein [unclassified Sphingomonas]